MVASQLSYSVTVTVGPVMAPVGVANAPPVVAPAPAIPFAGMAGVKVTEFTPPPPPPPPQLVRKRLPAVNTIAKAIDNLGKRRRKRRNTINPTTAGSKASQPKRDAGSRT